MNSRFEIDGLTTFTPEFITNDYWESFYKGLLAPEKILLDLRRMEKAYLENDVHEMEITRPMSLKNLHTIENGNVTSSVALDALKSSGECCFKFGMELFSADFDEFYFHRIRDVRLVVKLNNENTCYLNAKLSLTKCMVDICNNAQKDGDFLSLGDQEILATSVAHKEPGTFDFSLSSDKRNHFEGCGAISEWELKITGLDKIDGQYPIKDVIIYLSYTAKN